MEILSIYKTYLTQVPYPEAAATLTLADVLKREKDCDTGDIVLSQGAHTISVQTDTQPAKVYLWLDPGEVAGCGQAGLNTSGCVITANGFDVYANIKSNTCTVHYLVCGEL